MPGTGRLSSMDIDDPTTKRKEGFRQKERKKPHISFNYGKESDVAVG